ncbi:MAG: hypothetical protein U1F43_16715 [Myxococcota bacterium]
MSSRYRLAIAVCVSATTLAVAPAGFAEPPKDGSARPATPSCYTKWAAKFEERGADLVADGRYDDVIVSIRHGAEATCSSGRAEVLDGKLVAFAILMSDGSFQAVDRTWKDRSNQDVSIINGISSIMVSSQGELFNVMWPKKIKPRAPAPR